MKSSDLDAVSYTIYKYLRIISRCVEVHMFTGPFLQHTSTGKCITHMIILLDKQSNLCSKQNGSYLLEAESLK